MRSYKFYSILYLTTVLTYGSGYLNFQQLKTHNRAFTKRPEMSLGESSTWTGFYSEIKVLIFKRIHQLLLRNKKKLQQTYDCHLNEVVRHIFINLFTRCIFSVLWNVFFKHCKGIKASCREKLFWFGPLALPCMLDFLEENWLHLFKGSLSRKC